MRSFGGANFLLRHARLEVRLIYTGFLLLTLVGMLTMAAFQLRHVGPTPARVASYYRGGDHGGEMTFPKTFRELIEVTHFHSFIMGIVYLVMAHLMVATGTSARMKLALIGLAFAGLAGDIVSPWLIRFWTGGFAYLQIGSWACEWIGFGGFTYYPLKEMWFGHERDEFPPE